MKILYWIQPSWKLHLWNYLWWLKDAIKIWATVLIADYHALTSKNSHEVAENTHILIQQLQRMWVKEFEVQTSENTRLAWDIMCKTPMSDLNRMTQFKSKEWDCNAWIYVYPCLMAADIIISNPSAVIIWDDQIQHMEFYRRTCERMWIERVASNILSDTPRIMSIADPTKKWAKQLVINIVFIFESMMKMQKRLRRQLQQKSE